MGKTPVLLSAINTSQTNVLSQIQNLQSVNQEDLNLFRRELYSSLQHAFTRLSDQVESVGRAVESAEAAQRDSIRQLGVTIGSAMGEVISKMSEQIQHQIQHQNQQLYHGAYSPSQATFRQPTPFSVAQGIPIAQASGSSPSLFPAGTSPGSLANPNRYSGSWKREQDVPNYDEDEDEEEEDHGRGKRRAVAIERRPRSTSSTRKTVMRPRSEFDDL
ncbi:hypothetical protein BGW38_008571 [Lunasporangiospora selenospora]|uniref:Uncharacterized protein n=1 Tax=Lunasporangiospora selenospora TaxID=979761 RepID=A0A9P6FJR4_9FUNG|nr:hypothetical protein BGW38_008571 [Lunasporangiospora selenospora]